MCFGDGKNVTRFWWKVTWRSLVGFPLGKTHKSTFSLESSVLPSVSKVSTASQVFSQCVLAVETVRKRLGQKSLDILRPFPTKNTQVQILTSTKSFQTPFASCPQQHQYLANMCCQREDPERKLKKVITWTIPPTPLWEEHDLDLKKSRFAFIT